MKHRFFLMTVALMLPLWLATARADTIYFSDGSFIRCKVHDKPVVFVQKAKDPDFVEIEIPYGVLGFYKDEKVVKIEKDDLYSPEEKSMSLVEIFSRLSTESGNLLIQQSDQDQVEGRDLEAEVLDIIGWAFDKSDSEAPQPLTPGQSLSPDMLLSVPPNGRLKVSLKDTVVGEDSLAVLGFISSSTARLGLSIFNQASDTNIIPIEYLEGKVWIESRDPFSEGRKNQLEIGPVSVLSETATFYMQSLDNDRLKVALAAGPGLAISVKDVVEDIVVEDGNYVVLRLEDGSQVEKGRIAEDELLEWKTWDAWEPTTVSLPLSIVLPDLMSYPPAGPDFITEGDAAVLRRTQNNQPLHTQSLGERLQEIRESLQRYFVDVGAFPTKEQGLAALFSDPGVENWKGPYLQQQRTQTVDFWGNDLIYDLWTDLDGKPIADVRSAGPNEIDNLGLEDDLR